MTVQVSTDAATDGFCHPRQTFYPSRIPVEHNQLRQLISSPSPSIVYFVNDSTVFRLDTRTKTRTYVEELPFSARCAATGYGYFCAGGDNHGHFVSIKLPDEPIHRPSDRSTGHGESAHIRDRLPSRDGIRHGCLGSLIVNGISIHRIQCLGHGGHIASETIALVANNDQVVRIYSLERHRVLWKRKFACPMNHATISPNGEMMVVVGDCATAYVYRRGDSSGAQDQADEHDDEDDGSLEHPDWTLFREIPLHKPSGASTASYFTTAWSNTGRYLATASEHGFITLMSVEKILRGEDDPCLVIAPSSRAMSSPGSVRALIFAPTPWDMLIWTENYGRLCIADLRDGLRTRQVVTLDPKKDHAIKVELTDSIRTIDDPAVRDFDRDLAHLQAQARSSSYSTTNLHRPRGDAGLTEEESQIIGGLRRHRRRQSAMTASTRGANAESASSTLRNSAAYPAYSDTLDRELSIAAANFTGNFTTLSDSTQDSLRRQPPFDGLRQDAIESPAWRTIVQAMNRGPASPTRAENDSTPSLTPHLHSQVRYVPDISPLFASSRGATQGLAIPPSVREQLLALDAERSRRIHQAAVDESLTTRGAAVEARRRSNNDQEATIASASEESARSSRIAAASDAFRRIQLRNVVSDIPFPSALDAPYTRHQRAQAEGIVDGDTSDWGLGTTGIAWGRDRGTIFVGVETGIFEIELDYQSRKFWPAIDQR